MAGGGFGEFLGGLMENDTIKQIVVWQIIGQLINEVLAPYQELLSQLMNEISPVITLSPADLANSVVRGFIPQDAAAAEAKKAGIDHDRFQTLVRLAGGAPGPQQLAEALRRGIIPEQSDNPDVPSFMGGIAEGNLRDMWADMIKQLSVALPSPSDALDALLEGQIDMNAAKELYAKFGGDPEYFELLYNTRGGAPTPLEASVMANRGIIPWDGTGAGVVSYEQAFLEGPWRNKWAEPYRKMAQYIPTAAQTRSLLSKGAITHDQAVKYLEERGLDEKTAAAFLMEASTTKTAGAKALAVGTIETLYYDQIVNRDMAVSMLEGLKYTADEAHFILEVQDLKRDQHALSQALSKIHTLFVGHKLTTTDAIHALNTLAIPGGQVDAILSVWELERQANVKPLTTGEITDAFKDEIINQDEAMHMLEGLGYQPYDAWMVLSIKVKQALPGKPGVEAIIPDTQHLTEVTE